MKKNWSLLGIAFLVLAVLSTGGCKKDKNADDTGYGSIKNADWRSNIGDSFEVEGYYDEVGGIGKLLDAPKHHDVDAPTPEKDYILIKKPTSLTFVPDYSQYIGRKIRIKGALLAATEPSLVGSSGLLGDISLATLQVGSLRLIDSVSYFQRPGEFSLCDRYPALCQIVVNPFATKVAFLYSGGINSGSAYQRYYNDIKALYWILRNKYGYSDANIVVCYKNGLHDYAASDTFKIDYPATTAGFNAAITDLQGRMSSRTQFFCFINNHGGGFSTSDNINYGGTTDTDADEPGSDSKKLDEHIYYYGEGTDISDDLLKTKINSLTFGTGIFLLKPCFSGGLVYDLRGANRVIISSGTEFQVTYPTLSGNYGELTYNFMSAITGKTPDGVTVNADLNTDGKISMYEAYLYIKANEHRNEQPQYNDDGTGNVTTSPSSSGFGAGVFL
ncbi:MAG: hypothetical protein U0X41_02425 [Chitinophagales bacterium]